MSSFRIDRQYVAFETAETQPIHAKLTELPTVKSTAAVTPPSSTFDMAQLYNEIYERLRNEHGEQAEAMLSRAAEEAQASLEQAKRQAADVVSNARAEAEKLLTEARQTIEAEASARISAQECALNALETGLRDDYNELVEGMRSEVVTLVMEIVKKIIGIKLSQSDEVFVGLIGRAIEQLKQAGTVVIRVSPEDYQRYFGHERTNIGLDTGDVRMTIAEEPDFHEGDLVVESEGEMIDLSLNRQIDMIEKAFQG